MKVITWYLVTIVIFKQAPWLIIVIRLLMVCDFLAEKLMPYLSPSIKKYKHKYISPAKLV